MRGDEQRTGGKVDSIILTLPTVRQPPAPEYYIRTICTHCLYVLCTHCLYALSVRALYTLSVRALYTLSVRTVCTCSVHTVCTHCLYALSVCAVYVPMRLSFALLCAEGQVCAAFGRDTEMPVLPAVREVVEREMGI
jgi:hypothetical protein